MQSLGFSCPVCRCEYNDSDHLPRIIPNCGHTICSECLGNLLKNPSLSKCPLDSIPFPPDKKTIETFKVNFGLKELIEEASSQEVCPVHHEPLRLICYTDKKKICDDCVHFGDHKEHDIRSIKQIQPVLEEKRKKIEATIAGIDKHSRGAAQILDEVKDSLKEGIKEKFVELNWILKNKEEEMLTQVENFIVAQKKIFSNVLGFKSQLKNDLTKILSKYRDYTKYGDIFELIEEDVTPLTSKLCTETLKEYSDGLKKNLKEVMDSFDDKLHRLSSTISNFECPLQEIMKINNEFILLHNDKEKLEDKVDPIKLLEEASTLDLTMFGDLLTIGLLSAGKKEIELTLEDLKKVKRLRFCIHANNPNFYPSHQDKALFTIMKNLEELTSLEICAADSNIKHSSHYHNFIQFVTWKARGIKSLKIDFANCSNINDDIDDLLRKLLLKSKGLQTLYIDLSKTEITDQTISTIAENNLEIMKSIEHLHLAFQATDITDESTPDLFVAMPNVKSFCLNIMETELYDNTIEAFAKNSLPTMNNLQSLALLLSQTQVTDSGCTQLFCNMQNIKEFALALNKTKVGDMTVEVLATVLTSMSSNLEDFVLLLENTQVTDMSLTQICGLMENIKDFVLHLNGTRISDKTIEALSQVSLASMKKLQNLQLGLSSTQITDDGAIQLFSFQQDLSSFEVNFSGTSLTDNFGNAFVKALSGMNNLKNFNLNVSNTLLTMEGLSAIGMKRKEFLEKNKQ